MAALTTQILLLFIFSAPLVWCQTDSTSNCNYGDIRLANGANSREGRVEVCNNASEWGTVCDDLWDITDATVACKQLGFDRASGALSFSFFGQGAGPILLDSLVCTGSERRLIDCSSNPLGSHDCSHNEDAGAVCDYCIDGDIRLAGSGISEGRVEVCNSEQWGTVCDDSWDINDANIVCRQLGYTGAASAVSRALFGEGTGDILLDDVSCTGTESRLIDCPANPLGSHNCNHAEDAGVICTACLEGELRLVGGSHSYEGRVEYCYSSSWSTICDDSWDVTDATVVCKQLGFPSAIRAQGGATFGQGSGPIVLDDVRCSGSEERLVDCPHGGLSFHNCRHTQDAGVTCERSIRLSGGSNDYEGRVEVYYNRAWGTVCDNSFRLIDGVVVCSELGYGPVEATQCCASFGQGTGDIILDDLDCVGTEPSLFECSHSGETVHNCAHSEDVGVTCGMPAPCSNGDVRLVGGTVEFEGLVEICHDAEWGSVCDDRWDINDASVVCKQLGYGRAREAPCCERFGRSPGNIVLDDLVCTGSEASLLNCSHSGINVHNCHHGEDAGVICQLCSDGDVRLVGGANEFEGRVEVCNADIWGTVCDDNWSTEDGMVVCSQLGFGAVLSVSHQATFGQGTGPILLDDLLCIGSETSLTSCPHSGVGLHNCAHTEDAGVTCTSVCTEGAIRLRGSPNELQGRVEVCHSNEWGTVCDDLWDDRDAEVVCRQLGLRGGTAHRIAAFGRGSGLILLDEVSCNGSELTLFDCPANDINIHDCSHFEDASVTCISSASPPTCDEGELRLVGGNNEFEGRVEICHRLEWGTVCSNYWGNLDATVVCRQLGYAGGEARLYAFFGVGEDPIWLDNVRCDGTEFMLSRCLAQEFGTHDCSHYDDAGVVCTDPANVGCTQGDIRLVGGTTNRQGRVEVCNNNLWGTVCDDLFGVEEAQVACQQLGFGSEGATSQCCASYGRGTGSIVLDNVVCSGRETSLFQCSHAEINSHNYCIHAEDVGVVCPYSCAHGQLRLVGGTNFREGRVEVCDNEVWGTVCDHSWDMTDASVVCAQLGFEPVGTSFRSAHFGSGTGPIFLDDISCTGTENQLIDCAHLGVGNHNCTHAQDAGVRCPTTTILDGVSVESFGDHISSITVTFFSLEDNPFDYDYDYYGNQILLERADCFANKLIFSNGSHTVSPQYGGICTASASTDNRVHIRLDNADYLDFILAGFATPPYPQLTVYTNENSEEGDFPILSVPEDNSINVRYINYLQEFLGIDAFIFDSNTGVLVINFGTFIRLSSLDVTQIMFSSVYDFYALSPLNTFNLTSQTVLTQADELAIDVALQLSPHDFGQLQARNICISTFSCIIYSGPNLAESFNGLAAYDNHYGYSVKFISPVSISANLYMELTVQYLGYSLRMPLQYGDPYHLSYYGGHYERITSINCFANGSDSMDPELFFEGSPIDNQYLTKNWPTQITLSARDGIFLENLIGYFSCKTRGDTFNTYHIITHVYDYIYFFEGTSVTANLYDSVVIPFAHNYNFNFDRDYITQHYRIGNTLNPPRFNYTINVSRDYPFVAEFHLHNLQFSDSGNYQIFVYGNTPIIGGRGFNLTVIRPSLTITPSNLYVLPTDTTVSVNCTTTHPTIGTVWFVNGVDASGRVHSITNTLELDTTSLSNGTVLQCVSYDPDVMGSPQVIISQAQTILQHVNNPCLYGLHTCDRQFGTCTNNNGRYECGCNPGYVLGTDNRCSPRPTEPTGTPPVMCAGGNDPIWWLFFPDTLEGAIHMRECPQNGSSRISGSVARLCLSGGEWGVVDTSDCTRQDFMEVEDTAAELFAANISDINPDEVDSLIDKLVVATDNSTTGGTMSFARDLNTTNNVINSAVEYLLDSLEIADSTSTLKFNEAVIDVFDNILDETNTEGWQDLQEDSVGSQRLLLNAEMYGQYVAKSLMSTAVDIGNQTDIALIRDNIELSAKEIDPNSVEEILFPVEVKRTNETGSAQTVIPVELLKERGAEYGNVSAVNILFTNLKMFLPLDQLEGNTTRPVTPVISTQILTDLPKDAFKTPAKFKFFTQKFSKDEVAEDATCAFWDFELKTIVQSSWSTEGVNTSNVTEKEDGLFEVMCESSHVTSFAVLMDVTGVLNDTSVEEQFALTVISYVGCSISILFLLISIVYLLSLGKELFKKVHNFLHLNLSIALMLGYLVFVAGVDTAVVNRGLCVFIAALLHYLFTAAFFWMLCEGIMLYLMLVVVFSDVMKKWWIFFIVGWLIPVVPVAISVGVINEEYGTSTYCWIAVGDGTRGAIWAFVIPVLCIIMVNVFFLLAALRSVYRQKKLKRKTQGYDDKIDLFKQLFKAMIILLPLLGLTWIFGLLLVDINTTFFAWIFTVCNSLQGLFIFYFYVLRNIKMWKKISHRNSERRSTFSQSTLTKRSSTVLSRASTISNQQSFSEKPEVKGFQNPTFEAPIREESAEEVQAEEVKQDIELLDEKKEIETRDSEPVIDQSTLIDVDETLFEPEGSDKDSDDSDDENKKAWKKTITFNWMKPSVQDDLEAKLLAD